MTQPTIVIGADFSEGSRRAMQAVSVLARGAPARLRLVHAFPPAKPRLAGAPLRRVRASIAAAEMGEAAQLTHAAEALRKRGFDVETVAIEGKPAATLLDQARKAKAGLLAVGTSGKRGIGSLFLGSVAQSVLRDSPIPILVTPARSRKGPRQAGPVLAAVDLDDTGPAVLAAAASLARDLGVGVRAIHAVRIPFVAAGFPDGGLAYTPDLLEQDEADAAVAFTQRVEPLRQAGLKVKTHVVIGDAATHVFAFAQQTGASAIVVGRRKPGRRLGSTAAAVVQGADRPVVVVPRGLRASASLGLGSAR